MSGPYISILLLSWDRYDLLVKTLNHNLSVINYPYELLICDQGSKDKKVLDFLETKESMYFRKNSKNEGIGKSFNQLYLRSHGKYIALMSNDILWPANWGSTMVEWLEKVPNAGLCAFEWWNWLMPPLKKKFGYEAYWLAADKNRVYGPMMFKRYVVEQVGLAPESFGPYGEDFDFNERVNRAGFNSFYIPGVKAQHLGDDVGEQTEYRKMKDASVGPNLDLFWKRHALWEQGESIREPLPPLRDPL